MIPTTSRLRASDSTKDFFIYAIYWLNFTNLLINLFNQLICWTLDVQKCVLLLFYRATWCRHLIIFTHILHRPKPSQSTMPSTRFVVKPEGGQQCIFDYFWLNCGGQWKLGVERHQRVKPPTSWQIEHWPCLPDNFSHTLVSQRYKSALCFSSFRDIPHIHLTMMASYAQFLPIFADFQPSLSRSQYQNTLDTRWISSLSHIVKMGDNFLYSAQADYTLA